MTGFIQIDFSNVPGSIAHDKDLMASLEKLKAADEAVHDQTVPDDGRLVKAWRVALWEAGECYCRALVRRDT